MAFLVVAPVKAAEDRKTMINNKIEFFKEEADQLDAMKARIAEQRERLNQFGNRVDETIAKQKQCQLML